MNKRKGISLIVLVITILVMIILAGVVVVSLQKNNPIEKAKTAKDTSNLSALKEELELYKTNELMQGNKDANNISFTETEVKDILKNIPDNLKGKIVVSNGKLGVGYSKITEEARDYARKNDIFDAEDKIAPDADIYVETRNGKKYVIVDAVDYQTDVNKIICTNTGAEKQVDMSKLKIAFVPFDRNFISHDDTEFFNKLKRTFTNIERINDLNNVDVSKYNAFILHGGARWGSIYNGALEKKIIDKFLVSTKQNPVYVISSGNDSATKNSKHPLIVGGDPIYEDRMLQHKKLVDNIFTRQTERWIHDNEHENYLDGIVVINFKESPYLTRYYEDVKGVTSKDNCAVYVNKNLGQGWMHMHTGPYIAGAINAVFESSLNTYKAAFVKLSDIGSMEIDVTGVTPGTKYSFTVTDLAGNKVIKEITL